jgi:nucleotide-binding universal stress UspA family protein
LKNNLPGVTDPSPFTKILAAVDGSSLAENAGLKAAEIAARYSAALIVFHVAKYASNSLGVRSTHTIQVGLPLSDPLTDKAKQLAKESMERIASHAMMLDVPTERQIMVTSSPIVETIANFAYRNSVDLVVVGSTGTNDFRATLMGSVAEDIVREAKCAVMIVR